MPLVNQHCTWIYETHKAIFWTKCERISRLWIYCTQEVCNAREASNVEH